MIEIHFFLDRAIIVIYYKCIRFTIIVIIYITVRYDTKKSVFFDLIRKRAENTILVRY